jgi:hypothetical protein
MNSATHPLPNANIVQALSKVPPKARNRGAKGKGKGLKGKGKGNANATGDGAEDGDGDKGGGKSAPVFIEIAAPNGRRPSRTAPAPYGAFVLDQMFRARGCIIGSYSCIGLQPACA